MMKKNIILLVVLVVVLIAAVAAYSLLLNTEGPDPQAEASSQSVEDISYVLGGVPQHYVQSIAVENTQGSYTIQNGFKDNLQPLGETESAHTIAGIDIAYLNQSLLQNAFSTIGSLPAKKVVSEDGGADLSLYGLNAPSATVTATFEGGEKTLLLGDDSPGGEGVYAAVDGKVYLLDANKVRMFREPRFYFVSTTISEGNSQSTVPTKLTLSGDNFAEPVVIEKQPDDEVTAYTGLSPYQIVSPVDVPADSDKGIQPLQTVFGLGALAAVADVENSADELARYNLDQPYLTVAAQAEGIASFTLQISQAASDGNHYVKSSASPFIYQVAAVNLPFLDFTLFDLQSKTVLTPSIGTVSEVEVTAGDRSYVFEISGEGKEIIVNHNGKPLDSENFRNFYQTLISANYDSEIGAGTSSENFAESGADEGGIEMTPEQLEAIRQAFPSQSSAHPPDGVQVEDPGLLIPDKDAESETASAGESETETASAEESGAETASAEESADEEEEGGERILQFTFRYRDGSDADVISFYAGPVRRAVVSLNGGTRYYTRSVYVDRVLKDLQKVAAGQEVQSYL